MTRHLWVLKPVTFLLLASLGFMAAKYSAEPAPRYYWYSVAGTDSIRALLVANPGSRLRMQERTKDHWWIGVIAPDTTARLMGLYEVEESFPCPPICR